MDTELLPCPFCGFDASIFQSTSSMTWNEDKQSYELGDVFIATCVNPHCDCSLDMEWTKREGAVKAWNTRHESQEVILLRNQLKAIQEAWFNLDRLDIGSNMVVNGGEAFDVLYHAINQTERENV